MSATQTVPRPQSKSITLLYGSITAALLLVIAAVAIVVKPPAPPGLAEFAPQAEKPIEEAPQEQSSQFGAGGAGQCAAGQDCEGGTPSKVASSTTITTIPAKREIVQARVRRCFGDPPRQTEDPQSPPCVNYFDGDNGGATSRGVTRETIRIGFGTSVARLDLGKKWFNALVTYFNRRFEFYGRQLQVVPVAIAPTSTAAADPVDQRARAAGADEQQVFAMVGSWDTATDQRPYFDELARRKIVSFDDSTVFRTSEEFERQKPYSWSYPPTHDELLRNNGEWMCNSLVGRPPKWAGPPISAFTSPRAFGVAYSPGNGNAPDVSLLTSALARCGAPVITYPLPKEGSAAPGDSKDDRYRNLVAKMNSDGRTSIICVCSEISALIAPAAQLRYEPEWILYGGLRSGQDDIGGGTAPDQQRHMFGMAGINKQNRVEDQFYYQAMAEGDPSSAPPRQEKPVDDAWYTATYHALLGFASGVQAAGPNLTPENMQAGLFRTKFSNDGAGAAPYFQASVGFSAGDRTMIRDYGFIWWTPTVYARATVPGGFCWVARGVRYSAGKFPKGEINFFDQTQQCP